MLTVAAIQHADQGSMEKTQAHLEARIEHAVKQGAKLVCLQELHHTSYFCQTQAQSTFEHAQPLDGEIAQWLGRMAEKHQVVLVGSLFERRGAGVYHNTALVFDCSTALAGFYRKMHIPDDPNFYEKYYFTPGDAQTPGFTPIATSVGKLGVLVCWDQWYPEAARLMALAGADILIYPTAIGWEPEEEDDEKTRQREAWQCIQRGHAVANHLPVIAPNRWGHEPDPSEQTQGTVFWGHSFICGPQGEWLAQANEHDDSTLLATLDLNRTEQLRQIWPFLRDRRVDAYDGLLSRYLDQT